jgi:hypothetical protein
MQVCGREFDEALIGRIRAEVGDKPVLTRRRLSLQVCGWLKWASPNGKPKEVSCRVALLKLERRGLVKLPAPHRWGNSQSARRKLQPSGIQIDRITRGLAELGGIELVRLDSHQTSLSKIWNGLMQSYHYLGAGPLCGAQIRYLIKSEHYGWLGGLAFSAAAWRLKPRDQWIGWDEEARKANLNRVVCNSRFLIPSQVQVPNLASHVLSLAARRLSRDWNERYGLTPLLLETFVEKERFAGTSYQAANWQKVGETQGRGRQDRQRNNLRRVKDIYVYPLVRDPAQSAKIEETESAGIRLGGRRIRTGGFRRPAAGKKTGKPTEGFLCSAPGQYS